MPVLILLGLSPHVAVASNRVGVFGLSITGWVAFQRQRLIRHRIAWGLGLACGIGAIFGTVVFLTISESSLRRMIAAVSAVLLAFTAFKKEFGVDGSARNDNPLRWVIGFPLAFLLGAYGSLYGAGLGTFLTYLLVVLFGLTFLESAGTRKVAIGMQAIVSSILYFRAGLIHWQAAINLFVAMAIGSYVGAIYGSKLGNVWIRRSFLTLAALLCLKLWT